MTQETKAYVEIKDDTIIGKADDIIKELVRDIANGWYEDAEEADVLFDLVQALYKRKLMKMEDDTLKCVYHPMGAWYITTVDTL